ncbi:MAG: circadian clock protein KaiC, partial [Actinomycetota bacterium]|nr:circadian clock protein KaiC [Actinomycetota bacterium]
MTLTQITRMPPGCPGLHHVRAGGLPEGRSTLVSGTAGSGKTVLALQFLHDGLRDYEQPGVFITFEERPEQLRANAASLGFDIAKLEEQGKWLFVDASYSPDRDEQQVGPFDFGALLLRLRHAVEQVGATRVALDSIGAVFTRYQDANVVRRELMRVTELLRELGVTAVVTSERAEEYGQIGRHGVEEFVCDNVIVLRNALEEETRRRTIEVLKMRGVDHLTGEFPFTIVPHSGIVVITLENTALNAPSADERIHSGLTELDEMCNGGMFRDSINLVSGATGTGKTLLVSEFTRGGASRGERSLIVSFEESRSQLFRNAAGWGMDFEDLEANGFIRVEAAYPEIRSLEDHLVQIKRVVEEYQP